MHGCDITNLFQRKTFKLFDENDRFIYYIRFPTCNSVTILGQAACDSLDAYDFEVINV